MHFASVLLGDVLRQSQSKSDTILLACTHEWLKERLANCSRHAAAVIGDTDSHPSSVLRERNLNDWPEFAVPGRLTCIENKIVKRAPEFSAIDPCLDGRKV